MRVLNITSVSNRFGKLSASADWGRYLGDMIIVLLFLLALVCVRMVQAAPGVVVTLALSSSSVTTGTPVSLTASVTALGVPVTNGTVTFCDANAPYCENSAVIGTSQLTAVGTASMKFVPGIGTHSYKAVFSGTSLYLSGASPAQPLTVTGNGSYASTTSISFTGVAGSYSLTGSVAGKVLPPTGSVSFLDTSNDNFSLGSATLGSASSAQSFLSAVNYPTDGPYAVFVATGDFNGDGFTDLAVATGTNPGVLVGTTISILLGKGDGTFQAAPFPSPIVGNQPFAIAVGDFNHDGKTDLAVVNMSTNNVSVLLGNGDGSFQTAASYSTGGASKPDAIAVGDINNDGILDLVIANQNGTIAILLGNANGSFNGAATIALNSSIPSPSLYGIAVGKLTTSGFVDIVVVDNANASVYVLKGTGSLPVSPATPDIYAVGTSPESVTIADFNGDGNLDLAVTNSPTGGAKGSVSVLLGSANGSFTTKSTNTVGLLPYVLTTGDFNGDGIADLAVPNVGGNNVSVLLGKGDGTFSTQSTYATGTGAKAVAVGDFNGDGLADIAVSNRVADNVSILLNSVTQTVTGTLPGVSIPGVVGSHLVDASYPGDSNFSGSTSGTISLTGTPEVTTLALSASPASTNAGQSVVLTATLSPSTLGNLVTTGEVVTFYSGSTVLGTGTLNAFGIATFSTSTLPVGTASLTATYVGDANFLTSTSPAFREVVDPTGTGVLDIHGRWEFAITSGDSPAQLSMSGQSTISSYILQSGTALTNIVPFNTDTIICDTDGLNNATVIGSSIDTGGNVSITFSITDAASPTFQYVFTGLVTTGPPMTIIGTYQKSSGGCTMGNLGSSGTPDGTFSATYFPDISGTWTGDFDADTGTGPTSPATFVLSTNPDKSLSGTVTTALANAALTPCFVGPVTLTAGMAQGTSQSSGIGMELFGTDGVATLWVNAYATNPDGSVAALGEDNPADGSNGTINDGTNNAYTAFYGISGGPCDGLGGGDAPFKQVVKKTPPAKHHGHHEHHEHHAHHHRFHHHLKSEDRQTS